MKLLKEIIPHFVTLYKDKRQDGILLSTYSRSMFDRDKMKPIANELVEILRRHKVRRPLHDDKPDEIISQLMVDLAQEIEDQLKH